MNEYSTEASDSTPLIEYFLPNFSITDDFLENKLCK
jgi:hypothetical protein